MKVRLIISFLLLIPKAVFGQTNICDRAAFSKYITAIQEYHLKYDLDQYFNQLEATMKTCKISARNLGVPDDFLANMKRESALQEYKRTKKDIEELTETGKPDMLKKDYDYYTRKLKIGNADKYWADQEKKSLPAYAEQKKSCTPVDMSAEMGPIRNQDSVGWCYAFTTADLISYKTKQRISAADIAYSMNYDVARIGSNVKKLIENGHHVHTTLMAMQEKGFCLEQEVPSEDNANSDYEELLTKLQKLKSRGENCSEASKLATSLFPRLSAKELETILTTSGPKDFMKDLSMVSCKNRTHVKYDTYAIQKDPDNPDDLAASIDKQLEAKNPVGVTYDASGLYSRRDFEKYQSHASSIVGRRFNEATGQCEYLLRNSWGRTCSVYDSHYSCKNGNVWIPKVDMIKRTDLVTYVK